MITVAKDVELRRTAQADLPDVMALWNDGRVMSWVGFPEGLGYDKGKIADWYEILQSNSARHHFVVHAEHIGFCGEAYYSVDVSHGRAGLDIKFTPSAQGKGLAAATLMSLIKVVFESELEVNEVWTEPSI